MVAAQDSLFFQHDLHLVRYNKSVNELDKKIIYPTGTLLYTLCNRSSRLAVRKSSGLDEDLLSGELLWKSFVLDIQHLLWSLQQTALEAFIRHILNIIEAHSPHSHRHWQRSKRIGEGWYAEWPNSHRPLSTTWPWNIKPSLLVLWGVCWMFYGPFGTNRKRATRNPRGAAPLSEDLRTGPVVSQSQPRGQQGISSRQPSHGDFCFTDYFVPQKIFLKLGLVPLQILILILHGRSRHDKALRNTLEIVSHTRSHVP